MRAALILAVVVAFSCVAEARGGHGGRSYSGHSRIYSSGHTRSYRSSTRLHSYRSSRRTSAYHAWRSRSSPYATHDREGRIKRSAKAKDTFERSHPCPSTGKSHGACPGYVVDHVRPLECGGADAPSNMQWQTTAAAKQKDKSERYCR